MNPVDRLMNDEVYIENAAGQRAGPYKTAFQNHEITVFDETMDVTEGDTVVRVLPSGKESYFTVLEIAFQQKFQSIPAHYTLRLEEHGLPQSSKGTVSSTTVNISNSQGIQIGENNSQNICNSIRDLVIAIETSATSDAEKKAAKDKIRELLSNPTVAAVLGGAASAILATL